MNNKIQDNKFESTRLDYKVLWKQYLQNKYYWKLISRINLDNMNIQMVLPERNELVPP